MSTRRFLGRIIKSYAISAIVFTVVFGLVFYIYGYMNIRNGFISETGAEVRKIAELTDSKLNMVHTAASYVKSGEGFALYAQGQDAGVEIRRELEENSKILLENGIKISVSKLESSLGSVISADSVNSVYDFMTSKGLSGNAEGVRQYFDKNEKDGVFARYCPRVGDSSGGLLLIEKSEFGAESVYVMCFLDDASIFDSSQHFASSLAILDGNNIICTLGENTFKTSDAINNYLKNENMAIYDDMSRFIGGMLYHSASSKIYKWSYVLSVPADKMRQSTMMHLFLVLASCFVLMCVLFGLMYLLSRWVYIPVEKTMNFLKKYNSGEFFDEGVYIRQSFADLSDKNDELKKSAAISEKQLKEKFLKDLMFGVIKYDDVQEDIKRYGIEDIYGPYRVILIKFANYDTLKESFPRENIEKIKNEIKEFINDQLKEMLVYRAIETDSETIAFIFHGRSVRQLREILADMAMMVQGSFEVEITGAVGNECEEILQLEESYKSSCDIMANRFSIGGRNAIVTEEDVPAANSGGFFYPLDTERELITNVIRARRDETRKVISLLCDENFRKRSLSRDRIEAFIFAITATVNRTLEMMGKTAEEVFGEGRIVFLELKMCRTPEKVEEKIYEIFDIIEDCIDLEDKNQRDDLSELMLSYIHEHYNEDISLLDISGHFNLSQCYTSTLFKDSTGENFKDYLSRYRIKKAKEILEKDSSIKNSQLAKMIGCNTVATLFRLFNKYEGMSPGQYIKNIKN